MAVRRVTPVPTCYSRQTPVSHNSALPRLGLQATPSSPVSGHHRPGLACDSQLSPSLRVVTLQRGKLGRGKAGQATGRPTGCMVLRIYAG